MGGWFKLVSLLKYRGGLQPAYSESYVFAPSSRFRNKVDQEDRWRCSKDNVSDQFAISERTHALGSNGGHAPSCPKPVPPGGAPRRPPPQPNPPRLPGKYQPITDP